MQEFDEVGRLKEKSELKSNEWGEWHVVTRYSEGRYEVNDDSEIITGSKDKDGNVTKKILKDGRELTYEFKDGLQVGFAIKKDNKLFYSSKEVRREDGLLLEEISVGTDPDFKRVRVIYRYDSDNNWIEKMTFENEELNTFYTRKIFYYE